jgi:hypothetical protein
MKRKTKPKLQLENKKRLSNHGDTWFHNKDKKRGPFQNRKKSS